MNLPTISHKHQSIEEKNVTENKNLTRTKYKIIIFNIINVVLFVILFIVIQNLPKTAREVKELRSQVVATQEDTDIGILEAEIEKNKENINLLSSVFIDDAKFLRFITSMNEFQQNGVIQDYALPVTSPVTDSDKNKGLPISFVVSGTQEQVNQSFKLIDQLPYVIKPVNVNVDVSDNGLTVRYGGFVFTDDGFNEN